MRRHANGVKIRPLHLPICEDEAAFQESADSTIKRIKDRDPDDGKGITPLAAAQTLLRRS